MAALSIAHEHVDGTTVMSLSGSAAIADLGPLEQQVAQMLAALPTKLVIDVSGLRVLSSLAMGQFMTLAMQVKKNRGSAVIVAPLGNVREALLRVEIDKRIPLVLTLKEGLNLVARPV